MKQSIYIYTFRVPRSGSRLQFQVSLPKGTSVIESIGLSCSPLIRYTDTTLPNWLPETGTVWLRMPSRSGVFFSGRIIQSYPLYNRTISDLVTPGDFAKGSVSTRGGKDTFQEVNTPVSSSLIEGYYEDEFLGAPRGYDVLIYFKLKS